VNAMAWLFLAIGVQFVLVAMLARSTFWRAAGISGFASVIVLFALWTVTDGAQKRTEAWLILTSLPLIAMGAFAWRRRLGKLAMILGVILTVALMGTWQWATLTQDADGAVATIAYAFLVLVAMVALFMIGGVLGLNILVERTRNPVP